MECNMSDGDPRDAAAVSAAVIAAAETVCAS